MVKYAIKVKQTNVRTLSVTLESDWGTAGWTVDTCEGETDEGMPKKAPGGPMESKGAGGEKGLV